MEIKLAPVAVQITFDASIKYFKSKSQRVKFYTELYGYTNYSKYSEYNYKRQGVLSDISYLKPN